MKFRYYTRALPPASLSSPSRARITLLWFLVLIAIITYLDRICISAAAPYITDELQIGRAHV